MQVTDKICSPQIVRPTNEKDNYRVPFGRQA